MPPEPRDLIEHVFPGVIVKHHQPAGLFPEQLFLKLLGEKFRAFDFHRLELLARPHIHEENFIPLFRHLVGAHQHREIVLMAGVEMGEHLARIQFRPGAKFRECLLVIERAALAAAEMIPREQRPPRSR